MKFRILLKTEKDEWWESYDKDTTDPQVWAEETIQRFNDTLRPHELARQLLRVEVIEQGNERHHKWVKRTDGMSVPFRGCAVDLMFCSACGITGKRFGVAGHVKIDSKYRKKAYLECHTAKIQRIKDDA